MQGDWHFSELIPGQKIREATQDEFFSADVIRGAADALVREGIQNSLDAGINGSKVQVVITLGTVSEPKSTARLRDMMSSGWRHFHAQDNGLSDAPSAASECRYLVFEDFGTSGLTGDPRQLLPIAEVKNRFFHFFRVEGRSDKRETDRGRWGVGKQVFPRASRIKSVLGLTIRQDDGDAFLMGQAILRSHDVGGTYYQDGWFGVRTADERAVYPVEGQDDLQIFREIFQLRRSDEPGLSLVVPYLQADITESEIVSAVLRGYFYPILTGMLDVSIRGNGTDVKLDSDSISECVDRLPSDLKTELRLVLDLAIWARNNREPLPELTAPDPQTWPQWNEGLIPEDIRSSVRDNLRSKSPFGLRIPLSVRPRERGRVQRPSHFDVYMVQDDREAGGRPVFIREGIIVSDVRGHRARGVRSLVVVDRGPLATMLGDSENPAHTQWQKDGSKFKDRYYYGPSYIRFVSDSVAEIVRLSTQTEDQEDLSLLSDIFSLPADDGKDGVDDDGEDTTRERERKVKLPEIPSGSDRLRFAVNPVEGGFTVSPQGALDSLPMTIRVRAAYDVRRGNAFRKYNKVDFRLDRMTVQLTGGTVSECRENQVVVQIEDPRFLLTVRGFDPRRDVRVSVLRIGTQ